MKNEFHIDRTALANAFAAAGAELLAYTRTGGALAAIPGTEPQQYVAAGTLESIGRVMGAAGANLTDDEIIELAGSWDLLSIQDGGRVDRSALIGFAREVIATQSAKQGAAVPWEMMTLLQDAARAWNNEVDADLDAAMERIECFLIDSRAAAPTSHAQVLAEVRDHALEEAAHITQGNERVRDNGWIDCANERARCAQAIRALKTASASNEQGGA